MIPLFSLGQIVAMPGGLAALERAQQPPDMAVTQWRIACLWHSGLSPTCESAASSKTRAVAVGAVLVSVLADLLQPRAKYHQHRDVSGTKLGCSHEDQLRKDAASGSQDRWACVVTRYPLTVRISRQFATVLLASGTALSIYREPGIETTDTRSEVQRATARRVGEETKSRIGSSIGFAGLCYPR
jgi:hypothetical protein